MRNANAPLQNNMVFEHKQFRDQLFKNISNNSPFLEERKERTRPLLKTNTSDSKRHSASPLKSTKSSEHSRSNVLQIREGDPQLSIIREEEGMENKTLDIDISTRLMQEVESSKNI